MSRLTSIQRNALILAGALSAFTLLLIGAVAGRVSHDAARVAVAPTVTVAPTAEPTAGPDPAVQALLDERDAAYQDVIQQANDRLAQANVQLQSAYAAAAASAASAAAAARPVAPPAPAYIGPERAAEIALGVVPGAAVQRMPELVNFQGAAAYEVVTSTGSVYVDALSGQLLFNGAAAPVAASSGGGRGGEREGREHDDDGEEHDG
ncbi:MAG: PepSY domain-containing protein [Ardenticatenales bacterium]